MKRTITMKWNQRNIDRMTRLFNIEYDFSGGFTSRIGNGYKMANNNKRRSKITFCFDKKEAI